MLTQKNFFESETPQGVSFASNLKNLLLSIFEDFFLRPNILKCQYLGSWQSYGKSMHTKMTVRVCSCVQRYKINCYDGFYPSYAYKYLNFFRPFWYVDGFSLQVECAVSRPENFCPILFSKQTWEGWATFQCYQKKIKFLVLHPRV